ncbi:MAG TPA: hypothetical protein VL404_02495 [Candidatus Eisenbacteria bacterium]|nr:hypothetical protein [Candidatus Eisenbacteria bacterium]
MYLTKCAKCHRLYPPAGYDDAKWDFWMKKMKKKAHLSDGQEASVRRYTETLRKSGE